MIREQLKATSYEVYTRTKSRIDPEESILTLTGIKCPRCKSMNKPIGHGETVQCTKCGLTMQLWGAVLEVTAE